MSLHTSHVVRYMFYCYIHIMPLNTSESYSACGLRLCREIQCTRVCLLRFSKEISWKPGWKKSVRGKAILFCYLIYIVIDCTKYINKYEVTVWITEYNNNINDVFLHQSHLGLLKSTLLCRSCSKVKSILIFKLQWDYADRKAIWKL